MGEGKAKIQAKSTVERVFSAGGVVFRKNGKEVSWLIIQPTGLNRWQFPKGLIDPGEASYQTAVREVEEEGAVRAKIIKKLATSQFFFVFKGQKIFKTVTYFLMEYLENSPKGHDKEVQETRFVPFKEAHEILAFKDDRENLIKAKDVLEAGIQPNLV
jgi:8-oxo-dGTP diphosphatase